jgi:hypothetical protein
LKGQAFGSRNIHPPTFCGPWKLIDLGLRVSESPVFSLALVSTHSEPLLFERLFPFVQGRLLFASTFVSSWSPY